MVVIKFFTEKQLHFSVTSYCMTFFYTWNFFNIKIVVCFSHPDEEKLHNTAYSIENSIKCKASSITSDSTPVICSPRDILNDDYGSVVEDFLKLDNTRYMM